MNIPHFSHLRSLQRGRVAEPTELLWRQHRFGVPRDNRFGGCGGCGGCRQGGRGGGSRCRVEGRLALLTILLHLTTMPTNTQVWDSTQV